MKKTLQYYLKEKMLEKNNQGHSLLDCLCGLLWLQIPILLFILTNWICNVLL